MDEIKEYDLLRDIAILQRKYINVLALITTCGVHMDPLLEREFKKALAKSDDEIYAEIMALHG
jgi:hypothetical protein